MRSSAKLLEALPLPGELVAHSVIPPGTRFCSCVGSGSRLIKEVRSLSSIPVQGRNRVLVHIGAVLTKPVVYGEHHQGRARANKALQRTRFARR